MCLLNDAIIYSESEKDHLEHWQAFFQRLSDYRLTLNPNKCIFNKKKLDFLGNSITQNGFQPLQDKVAGISTYLQPNMVNELPRFLGL